MVEHRKTPSRKAFVPPSWFIVLTVVAILGSAGWLGWFVVDGNNTAEASGSAPVATPTTSAPVETTPSPTPKPTPTPTPTASPTPEKTKAPEVLRDARVSVLNNTRSPGLAASFAGRLRQAGWTVAAVGNWRGSVVGNTVYYPGGLEDRAALLGKDLGIGRILPSVAPMRMDRLTVILSGQQ